MGGILVKYDGTTFTSLNEEAGLSGDPYVSSDNLVAVKAKSG